MTELHWLVAAASLAGVVLNILKDRRCYGIWIVTNTTWAAVDWGQGLHAQATLMSVYAALAVWGWISWRPAPPSKA